MTFEETRPPSVRWLRVLARLFLVLWGANTGSAESPPTEVPPARGFYSTRPGRTWEEYLVTGNGVMGAMVAGAPTSERIILNHALLHLPAHPARPPVDQAAHLAEIRQRLLAGQFAEASRFVEELAKAEGYVQRIAAEGLERLPTGRRVQPNPAWDRIAASWTCPEWYQNAKFGLWLHWGPQAVPAKGGGWYARHMYLEKHNDSWGKGAWEFHRATYGHQSEFGFKDVCNLWQAEKFDAEDMVRRMKGWGARFVAILGNHHDNFDLFASSVHGWNSTRVGPKRDLVGEFAEAARRNQIPWGVSVHTARAASWLKPAFRSDADGPRKGVPYDGNMTKADGVGKWWEGLDPQQFYASRYPRFEQELTERHLELVRNYRPDLLYFDDRPIPTPMLPACIALYEQSRTPDGIQAVVTIKEPEPGALHDIEKGVAAELMPDWWQTDTTLAADWFFKPSDDGLSRLRHDARSLKEFLVDIVSKRGVLMLNISIRADGTVPDEQAAILDEVGSWLNGVGEGVYGTRPWKIHGEGGRTIGGRGNERGINSRPWDRQVVRFTQDKSGKVLYVHLFGDSGGETLRVSALGKHRLLFSGTVSGVTLLGRSGPLDWKLQDDGLHIVLPRSLPFAHANVVRISTSGL